MNVLVPPFARKGPVKLSVVTPLRLTRPPPPAALASEALELPPLTEISPAPVRTLAVRLIDPPAPALVPSTPFALRVPFTVTVPTDEIAIAPPPAVPPPALPPPLPSDVGLARDP